MSEKRQSLLVETDARPRGNPKLIAVPIAIECTTHSYTDEIQSVLSDMPVLAAGYGYTSFWLTAADETTMAATLEMVRARNPTRALFTVDKFKLHVVNGGVVVLCIMLAPGLATSQSEPARQLISSILGVVGDEVIIPAGVQQTAINKVWAAKHPRPSSAPRPAIKKSKKAR
jgi:hypothetical protein